RTYSRLRRGAPRLLWQHRRSHRRRRGHVLQPLRLPQGRWPGGKDLAFPLYDIDNQDWVAEPRDSKQALWTDPYFDAGGGEIWMATRSVPLLHDGYTVVTTDLPIAPPPGAALRGRRSCCSAESSARAQPRADFRRALPLPGLRQLS